MKKTLRLLALAMVTVILCLSLASCGGPSADPDKAEEALEKNDYKAEKIDSDLGLLAFAWAGKNVDAVVTGVSEDLEDAIVIIYYEDKDSANDAWEDVQEYAEEESDEETEWVCKKSGKMIYFGTKEAVKAAK